MPFAGCERFNLAGGSSEIKARKNAAFSCSQRPATARQGSASPFSPLTTRVSLERTRLTAEFLEHTPQKRVIIRRQKSCNGLAGEVRLAPAELCGPAPDIEDFETFAEEENDIEGCENIRQRLRRLVRRTRRAFRRRRGGQGTTSRRWLIRTFFLRTQAQDFPPDGLECAHLFRCERWRGLRRFSPTLCGACRSLLDSLLRLAPHSLA